ncbi:MAG TPA: cysteine hydrolase [Flavitalea sp.]|nr:cysteine hydrolase [Flavitalea sp.]
MQKTLRAMPFLLFLFVFAGSAAQTGRSAAAEKAAKALTDRWSRPALLIVDMQNDFVRVGAPMEVPDARATIAQHKQLIAFCRKAGIPVIYTRFLSGPHPTLVWNWSPKLAPPTMACRKGHNRYYEDIKKSVDCADIIEEIYPKQGDHIIDKFGYGAFYSTNLDNTLRSLGVESLILTGTVTQICVEETGREAFHHGYKTTLITDAVSSYMPDLHAAAIKNFGLKFGWTMNTEQAIKELSAYLDAQK